MQGTVAGITNAAAGGKQTGRISDPREDIFKGCWEETIKISKPYKRLDGDKCKEKSKVGKEVREH